MESNAPSFRAGAAAGAQPPPDNAAARTERIIVRQKVIQRTRGQRTRRTVDLPAVIHRALDIWQREAADRLGVTRVTGQEVLTALVEQLLADPNLSAQVTRRIQDGR